MTARRYREGVRFYRARMSQSSVFREAQKRCGNERGEEGVHPNESPPALVEDEGYASVREGDGWPIILRYTPLYLARYTPINITINIKVEYLILPQPISISRPVH